MRKTDKIRFQILKILKDLPTHGYNLFIALKNIGLVKNPSQVYKIINSMERKGLIEGEEMDSSKGPNKKQLYLTKKGKAKFYGEIVDTMKIMADFFMEASMNFKQSDNRFNLIQKRLNRYEHKTIYFNLERMPGIVQSAFIMNSIIPFAKDTDNTIYLNNMDNDPFFSYDTLVKEHIHILDENVGLNPGTVDLIFMNTRAFNPVFFEKFRNMIKVLKESGEIVLIYFKPRKKNLNPPNIKKLFKYLLNQISPEYQEELKSMIPFSDVKEGVLMNDKGSDAFLEEFAQSFEVVKELHSDENVAVFEFKLKKEP